jgi:predicted nuclease of predicted toxin-antitoxin system
VRILLDKQLPRDLARHLSGHFVRTVQQQGWNGLGNGALLIRAAAANFEIFVTADQNLQFQQNLAGLPLAVIVLNARSTAIAHLMLLVPTLQQAIGEVRPGEVRRVGTL